MKKVKILLCIFLVSVMIPSLGLFAQPTSNPTTTTVPEPMQLDEKTQKKVDKAKADLAKDQDKIAKVQADYEKDHDKFEKKKSKGDLSPNDISKGQKSLDKMSKEIEKLKKAIADNEKFLAGFNK